MIRNGDKIQSYTILATANGMALAHSETAPDPYVVWFIDEDGCGVRSGRYQQTKEDAEWDFCCKAFPWFEDNAPVNMIEDEAAERIEEFQMYLGKARSAIDSAATLVEDMVLEHGMLQGKKEAPQEKGAEPEIDYLSSFNFNEFQKSISAVVAKIKDEIKKYGVPCDVIIDSTLNLDVSLVDET